MAVDLAITCSVCRAKNASGQTTCLQCGVELSLTIPHHLAPLLLPTPSGVVKLLAAWDGLGGESQIVILTKLDVVTLPPYLKEKILMKALDSANSYVRYLAARQLPSNGDETLQQRLEQDPDPLVRYCKMEARSLPEDADTFFAYPQEARLATVRGKIEGGKKLAKFITHAFEHQLKEGLVSELEIYEILCDLVNKPSFRDYYADWEDRYKYDYPSIKMADIRALWTLVPKVLEAISYVLIENLPAKIAQESVIPNEVLKEMNSRQLQRLLNRSDVGLEEFRKELFWKTAPRDFMTWTAATSHNFDLDYTEFAKILARPKEERVEILLHLSGAEDLSLYLYDAIVNALLASDENAWLGERPPKVKSRFSGLSRLRGLHQFAQHEFAELRNLGLYRVASRAVRIKKGEFFYPLKGELEFLSKHVVEDDAWGTFMAFHEAWGIGKNIAWLSEYLPEWTGSPEDSEESLGDV